MKQKAFPKLYGDLSAAGPGHRIIPAMLSDHLGPRPVACKDHADSQTKRRKREMTGMWRNLVALTSVLLLGAALMANVSDGPMSAYRGSWLTRASR